MNKKNLRKPHSFSLSTEFIADMEYVIRTSPYGTFSKKAEKVLRLIVPHRKE